MMGPDPKGPFDDSGADNIREANDVVGFNVTRGSDGNDDFNVDSVKGGNGGGSEDVDGSWGIDDTWGSDACKDPDDGKGFDDCGDIFFVDREAECSKPFICSGFSKETEVFSNVVVEGFETSPVLVAFGLDDAA